MADDSLPPEKRREIARERALKSIAEKEKAKAKISDTGSVQSTPEIKGTEKSCPLSGSSKGRKNAQNKTQKGSKKGQNEKSAHSSNSKSQTSKKSSKNNVMSPKSGGASKYKGHKIVPNSSKPAPSDTTITKVVAFLARNPEMEYQPKTIARQIKEPHEAVKKAIQREMETEFPEIISPRRGWYRIVLNVDRIRAMNAVKRFGLHGIQVQGKMSLTRGDASLGTTLVKAAPNRYRKQGTYKDFFMGRIVTITVHEMGLVDVTLESNKNPLDYEQFNNFCYWLFGKFDGVVHEDAWYLINIGINVDINEMRTRGFVGMSLKTWKNAWFQMYQKTADVVRCETHIVPNMTLHDALSVMRSFVTDVELAQHFINPKGDASPFDSQVREEKPRSKWDFDPAYL